MEVLRQSLLETYGSLVRYLPYLVVGTAIAAALRVHMDQRALARAISKYARTSIPLVTLFATLTPFCSCGTVAVVLSMIASTVPWGPIVAFMASSPLMSPSQFVHMSGIMGWEFAVALLVASIAIGIGAGYVADILDRRGFLRGQARMGAGARESAVSAAAAAAPSGGCSCGSAAARPAQAGGSVGAAAPACGCSAPAEAPRSLRLLEMVEAGIPLGLRILGFFLAFSFAGHLLTLAFPSRWMLELFGEGRIYGVPLAASVGVPLYINAEVSMPLIKSFSEMGMSQGAALALIITGAGTSVGAIGGALMIARARVIGLVVASLWVGAVLAGYLYDLLLALALA